MIAELQIFEIQLGLYEVEKKFYRRNEFLKIKTNVSQTTAQSNN
jgi:hypothetical protein